MMKTRIAALALVAGATVTAAHAQPIVLSAVLSPLQEVPPVTSPGSGTATLTIDPDTLAWTLDISYGGMTSGMTVAHIHRAPAGSNGPVIIGLDGIPLSGGRPSWNLLPVGANAFSSGGPVAAPFAFPAAELANLLNGNTYINIHTGQFPGGELRGQLVPAPAAAGLLGLAGLAAARRRRR